ncbi:OHCU decarboxylase [Rubrivivax gelatinosus]|nr:OHCU decarboxylase [Rubrivivax gelatinosus]
MTTLAELNAASRDDFVALLAGVYEHSPWIAAAAFEQRPFASLAALKHALVQAVRAGGRDAQRALLRAHPELAGKAMVAGTLTAESSGEQQRAGLTACTPEEFATIQRLNAAYNDRFGWPFIVAVRGPRGSGLTRGEIIATLQRRLTSHPEVEFAECLRQVHRIAEIRLAVKFDVQPHRGRRVWDRAEALAAFSEPPHAERGELTVTYLSAAHRDCARLLARWMQDCGFDSVREDAVGNVVGVYEAATPGAPRLLTGSHYDTVRNGGRHDGRLGILVALEAVAALKAEGRRLPFAVELVAFAEEEGQRYAATFLGSSALTGDFHPAWLDQEDAAGVTMREAMRAAGLPATLEAIAAERRDPAHYLGFVEVHIEQGPVLAELDLPLGVVTSINGSRRWTGEITGLASHAGTTPMGRRRDAACAAAEFVLAAERCAAAEPDAVATVGMLEVPAGSINVVPGRCRISLDIRATTDAARDTVADAVLAELETICARRGVGYTLTPTMQAPAAPCAPAWQARWEAAVAALGLPVQRLPSGAGHDAMTLHRLMPQAMLFVRGGELGISHNPLETVTDDDAELAVAAFATLLDQLARE